MPFMTLVTWIADGALLPWRTRKEVMPSATSRGRNHHRGRTRDVDMNPRRPDARQQEEEERT
jgi:hypothetical protein